VAYAEKRGKGKQPWRVKYKLPSGMEISESGFETKAAALAWGRDQEARIREGRWTDPNAGKVTVGDWIDRWLPMQDVGISTQENREYMIRRFLRPAWGDSALNLLSTEEITIWENGLPARTGISRRVARDARSLLCTILGDAAAAKPPLIPYNPALRPRNRGRRTGRRLERAPQRAWATPLQALLLAERAALLSGRDDEFTMIVTIGYTGLRWGEIIGLEHEYAREAELHVEWQIHEARSGFHRLPPKDDSYRSPAWEPCLPVDLPPFLASLIARQAQATASRQCSCARQHGGSGRYLFLGPDGGHYRRSNYARRVFRPACDGRYQPGPTRPPWLVIADATIWPGVPVAWWLAVAPDAEPGAAYSPPRGHGVRVIPPDTPLACWLPIQRGLTPHGLRHGHKTWMAEDGIPEILAEQRLGHQVPGMRGLYAHASLRMREQLNDALQARWEDSLRDRTALHPRSPVPLLDELLAPFRGEGEPTPGASAPRDITNDPSRTHDTARPGEQLGENDLPNSSQIRLRPAPEGRTKNTRRASDLARLRKNRVELRGFEPLTPSMRTRCATGLRYSPKTPVSVANPEGGRAAVSRRPPGLRRLRTGHRAGR
jgi:hypothetical protein